MCVCVFRFRIRCQAVISHKMFDHVVLVFIFLNCITIALERPDIPSNSKVRRRKPEIILRTNKSEVDGRNQKILSLTATFYYFFFFCFFFLITVGASLSQCVQLCFHCDFHGRDVH